MSKNSVWVSIKEMEPISTPFCLDYSDPDDPVEMILYDCPVFSALRVANSSF